MKVALVGCGVMGQRHAEVLRNDPDARCVGVVDRDAARARAVAARLAAPVGIHEPPDAVIIATDTSAHVDAAAEWIAAGAWCLVEKPLAVDAPSAEPLRHPRVRVGHSERFNRAIRGAEVAGPTVAEAERFVPDDGRAADVDVITDLMVHDLDLLLGWSRDVRCVGARGERDRAGRWRSVEARLVGGGLEARVRCGRGAPRRTIRGEDRGGPFELDLLRGEARRSGAVMPRPEADALSAQWLAFKRAMSGQPSAIADTAAAIDVLRLADAVREALSAGPGAG